VGSGHEFVFLEQINQGAGGKCKGTGDVEVRKTPGGTLRYRFEGGGVTSQGLLVPASVQAVVAIDREAGVNLGGDCTTTTTGEVAETICSARPR
jgi:hypothetical protein